MSKTEIEQLIKAKTYTKAELDSLNEYHEQILAKEADFENGLPESDCILLCEIETILGQNDYEGYDWS